jgi:hypothetical protein
MGADSVNARPLIVAARIERAKPGTGRGSGFEFRATGTVGNATAIDYRMVMLGHGQILVLAGGVIAPRW